MLLLVRLQRTRLSKGFLTDVANVGPFARMSTLVTDDVALMMKPFVTNTTYVRALVSMRSAVNFQVEALEERFAALETYMISLLQMIPLHVFLHKVLSLICHIYEETDIKIPTFTCDKVL